MADSYTDGNIICDAFEAELSNGQIYLVDSLTLSYPQVTAERNDLDSTLAAKAVRRDTKRMSGTAELQISASVQNVAIQHETFIVPASASITGQRCTCTIEAETQNVASNETRVRSVEVRLVSSFDAMLTYDDGGTITALYFDDGGTITALTP